MDLGTILGLVIGFGLMIGAMMLGGGVMPFVDAQSAMIVIGGTFAATMINQRIPYVIGGLKAAVQAFLDKSSPKAEMVPLLQSLIAETLKGELAAMKERHERAQRVFKFMRATAPSMGLIGTIIGLVQMLQSLDDPDSIGPAMAVALLTTLYGAILAFVVYGPIGEKLANRTAEEVAVKKLAIAGVESILKGDNSMVIQSKLESFLSPEEREALSSD